MFFVTSAKNIGLTRKAAEQTSKSVMNNNIHYTKFASENNMDPYQYGFPHHLPKLSKIKEMLIACVHHVMKTYQLKGGMVGYKGDVLNIEQDK
eukprot:8780857-Ditylum_brightwellii.AAC.1